MEQSVINILSSHVPMVQRYQSQFSSLNTLLSKTTLTGKISSLDIAENLFDYMEKTQEKFENLQDELMQTIVEQNFYNAYEEALASARLIGDAIGGFIRGLHESILGLSRNKTLHEYAMNFASITDGEKSKESLENIFEIFRDFAGKSKDAYKDIFLFGKHGDLLESLRFLGGHDNCSKTKLQVILESDKVESYAEYYQKADFYYTEEKHHDKPEVFFVIPLRASKESQVCMVAVFVVNIEEKIKELLERFPYRLPQANLVVMNTKEHIYFSDNIRVFPMGQVLRLSKHKECVFLESRSKTCMVATETISNLEHLDSEVKNCKICRIVPLHVAFDLKWQINRNIDSVLLENSLLVTEKLDRVIAEGENINEELGDVVINGEIIASKSHSYALNPILNNIRILSNEMNTLCIQSTSELQKGIYSALFNVVEFYAKYLVFAVDTLLAKIIRDVDYLGGKAEFVTYLGKARNEEILGSEIKSILTSFVRDFSCFYNVVLFDKEGSILLDGLDDGTLSKNGMDFYSVTGSRNIVISNFEPTFLYGDKPTMLVYYALRDSTFHFVGGLVFVLDFSRIQDFLHQIFPEKFQMISENSEVFSVIFDNNRDILATTKSDFDFDGFLQSDAVDFGNLKKTNQIVKIKEKHFLICSDICQQSMFAEYTKRTLQVVIFVEVKEDSGEE